MDVAGNGCAGEPLAPMMRMLRGGVSGGVGVDVVVWIRGVIARGRLSCGGRMKRGFVDIRVMPRCAGWVGAKKMPGVN